MSPKPWILWSGTKCSSTTIVSLPEPRMPDMNQVGSIDHASAGMRASARGSPPSGTSSPMPSVAQSAANEPDEYGHRPLTR